jgi:putative tricarboxylic transport membrane protein
MESWSPDRPVRILAGTPPGGGLDRVARALLAALAETGLLRVPVEVVNVPGDGARKVWAEVLCQPGEAHLLCIGSTNLTTDRLLGLAAFGHAETTPIAILLSEAIAFCVPSDSPWRSGAELVRALAADVAAPRIVLATALGNPNHIALAQVARHAGADPRGLSVRAFDGAPEAVAAVVGGQADLGAVSAASVGPTLREGRLRVLAVSAPSRLPGPLAEAPSWLEQGVPCEIGAWRGVSGPPGLAPAAIAFWEQALAACLRTASWRQALEQQSWAPLHVSGPALASYLGQEEAAMRDGMENLGLLPARKDARAS